MPETPDIPDRYTIKSQVEADDLFQRIEAIYITGNAVDADSKNSVLHWRIFLATSEGSVRFDLAQGPRIGIPPRTMGILYIETMAYTYTRSARLIWRVVPVGGTTVLDAVRVWIRRNRDQYKYDGEERGCRWWCTCLLRDLVEAGLVRPGSMAEFEEFQEVEHSKNASMVPMPVAKGDFY